MALWVDKYRPKDLKSLDLHQNLSKQLTKMCDSEEGANFFFPHVLFYGPSGSGKKTRVAALLRELYGPGVDKVKIDQRLIKIPNQSKEIELATISSNYHIEMNPSDAGTYDRVVVQDVIKEIAQSRPIDSKRTFKVVVLNEVDRLSRSAQNGLRRTMEKYISSCRLILCVNSLSKVIEPLRSRCLCLRVPAPTTKEISGILANICKREGLTIPTELSNRVADQSERNLRRAILSLEATKVKQYPFTPDQSVERTDWEDFIIQVAKEIAEEQSPKRLMSIRAKLYELLSHCIPPEILIKSLAHELLKKVDSELKFEVIQWAAFYEHRLQQGSKPIFHLEAFVAKFMFLYKRFLIGLEPESF